MDNREKYDNIFSEVFCIEKEKIRDISFKGVPAWDSVGHMGLIARIEDEFNILIEAEDIFGFTDYEAGENILRKYGVKI